MKPLIIFGCGDLGQIAQCYFEEDGNRQVAAFTVDAPEAGISTLHGKPLISFATLVQDCPPTDFDLFVAIGYSKLNQGRAEVFRRCMDL
ncbi:MAG TPA: hypothetical protein VK956_12275, partial [Verrucomicrobium sp.]|nr:hypothetical protein [Verrucomicrobium sp.]